MKRFIYSLILMVSVSLSAFAQTEDFDPVNPPNPTTPTVKYALKVNTKPEGLGSLNNAGGLYEAGETVSLYAYSREGFVFQGWYDASGKLLSVDYSFWYLMPDSEASLTAVYTYDPNNPGNPEQPSLTHTLTLKAKPTGACTFNQTSFALTKGEGVRLNTYAATGFKFLRWEDENGQVLEAGSNNTLSYIMPDAHVTLYAVYEYDPSNPSNPSTNAWDSFTGEVVVDDFKAGSLWSAITSVIGGSSNSSQVSSLIVSGQVASNDVTVVSSLSSCTVLDLSRTNGVAEIPSRAYSGNGKLSKVLLPSCITKINNYAFNNCTALASLTCYAITPPTVGQNVFTGIPQGLVVYVPEASVDLYMKADVWKDFTIMPIRDNICNLELTLPQECSDGRYKNMSLELINLKSGQRYKYIVTDRLNYIFTNLPQNTLYNAVLKNGAGATIGQIDSIRVADGDQSLPFEQLKAVKTLSLKVMAGQEDVTSRTAVVWTGLDGAMLSMTDVLPGQVEGEKVKVAVTLPQELGMQYVLPSDSVYVVEADGGEVLFQLQPLPVLTLKGRVSDITTGEPLVGATVTVAQTLNGRYDRSFAAQTDRLGEYCMDVFAAPTTVTFASDEYVSQTIQLTDSMLALPEVTLSDIRLKSITGARISLAFTYRPVAGEGEEAVMQNWYSDYKNVSYTLYNQTRQQSIGKFNVQYPLLVLLEEVAEGDTILVTATSKNASFTPVTGQAVVDATANASVQLPIVQLGGVRASYMQTQNGAVSAILFDSKGSLVNKYEYAASQLTISELADGQYTLVTMGSSTFFNSFSLLSGFADAGLVEGTDYVKNQFTVESGLYTKVSNTIVPYFDESKLYFTGSNTAFTVNRQNVMAGNYLTLQAKVDFKPVYSAEVSDVELVFELPEGCSFVENSVLVGPAASVYQYEGNKVTVQLPDNDGERVRLCVIPTASGSYAPTAYVRFKYNGQQMQQPIGNAAYNVRSIDLSIPSLVSTPAFSASGTSMGNSTVEIYDGTTLIGQTRSLANGMWVASCQLVNPTNLSSHSIMAKVITKTGLEMQTEIQQLTYDKNAVEISQVRMYHWNPEMHKNYEVIFDFQHPSTVAQKYTYYIYNKQFTFTIDFTENDTTKVKDVMLRVRTGNGTWTVLPATFDAKKNCWVANGEFGNRYDGNVPKNVAVSYRMETPVEVSAEDVQDNLTAVDSLKTGFAQVVTDDMSLIDRLVEAYAAEEYDEALATDLENQVYKMYGLQAVEATPISSKEDADLFVTAMQEMMSDSIYKVIDNLFEGNAEELFGSADYAEGISMSKAEGLTDESLTEAGYSKVSLDNGTCVYFMQSSTEVSIVSLAANYKMTVQLNASSKVASLMRVASSSASFLAQANQFLADAQQQCNDINEQLGKIKDFLDTYRNALGVAYLKAKNTFASSLSTLKQYMSAHRAGSTVPGHSLIVSELKQTAKASGKVMIGTQSASIKISNAVNSPIGLAAQKLVAAFDIVNQVLAGVEDLRKLVTIYAGVPSSCPGNPDEAETIRSLAEFYGRAAILYYSLNIAADIVAINSAVASAAAVFPTCGTSLITLVGDLTLVIAKGLLSDAYHRGMQTNIAQLNERLRNLNCTVDNGGGNGGSGNNDAGGTGSGASWINSDEPDADVSIDPSGYVYEGVQSNRLQGVTATCYYKETVEDMYGDLHENIVLWDAAEYAQQNPLFTDEMGMYRWDVPEGLWQVKFEKEGYQTTYSEWLPVPPPQLEVNIAMKQNVQPEVKGAKAYEDGVEITFSKYMKPEFLTTDNLILKVVTNGTATELQDVTVQLLNAEAVSEKDATVYASKVVLKTAQDLGLVDEVYVIVSNKVQSYAGLSMNETYSQRLDVEKKVRSIEVDQALNLGYDQSETLLVGALPSDASKGKTLAVKTASDMIATISADNATVDEQGRLLLTLDENGQASIKVDGEMLGATSIAFEVLDANVTAQTEVNVVNPAKLEAVKEVMASLVSGAAVYRGQVVTLSCPTEGATIYYTTDGSCPCNMATALKYEGAPIRISEGMTIKAMAVGINGSESEVKEYAYTIKMADKPIQLVEGWNWVSHNQLADIQPDDLKQDYVNRVLSQLGELYKDPVLGFTGSIDDWSATQAVKVQATTAGSIVLAGEQFNPSTQIISLHEGWNWMGYPVDQTMTVDEALAYLEAEEGDIITSLGEGYAQYDGETWTGLLQTMSPGQGFLYKSASSKEFIYHDAIVSKAKAVYSHRLQLDQQPWQVNAHAYPSMMCVTADLYVDGVVADAGAYLVAAFVGDECRGIGRYVGDKLFMAVYGGAKAVEQVRFVAVDAESGQEYAIAEQMPFSVDAYGTVQDAYRLSVGDATSVSAIQAPSGNSQPIYNVMGQKMDRVRQNGIYVIGKQKLLIKK